MLSSKTIRVVMAQYDDVWIAQCLEFDIAAQAGSFAELQRALEHTLMAHVVVSKKLGREPFEGIKPAPQAVFAMFEESERVQSDPVPSASIPDAFILPQPEYRVSNSHAAYI